MAEVETSWREALTTRLGPFPAYVWGLGLGAGGAAYMAWRRRQTAVELPIEGEGSDTTGTDPEGSELVTGTATGYGDFTLSPSPMGGGSWAVAPAPEGPTGDPDEDETLTNGQWRLRAANWLGSDAGGRFSPTLVNDALVKFLDGNAVNSQEEAVIIAAIREFGQPPQGAPSLIRIPAPVINPPPPAAKPPTSKPPATVPPSAVVVPGPVRQIRWTASTVKPGTVKVIWVAGSSGGAPITSYRVAVHQGGNWRTVQPSDTWVADISGLSKGNSYNVRIAAVNRRGVGPYSTVKVTA